MEVKNYEAVKALIRHRTFGRDQYLLLKIERFIGGKYEVPGGRKNPGEEDETALRREVREEVGFDIKIIQLLNTWALDLTEKGIHLDGKTYLCDSATDKVSLSDEHVGYVWASREKLKQFSTPQWLKEAISSLPGE